MKRACPDCGAHVWQHHRSEGVELLTYACGSLFDTVDGVDKRHRSLTCHQRELGQALADAGATILAELHRTLRGIARAITRGNR